LENQFLKDFSYNQYFNVGLLSFIDRITYPWWQGQWNVFLRYVSPKSWNFGLFLAICAGTGGSVLNYRILLLGVAAMVIFEDRFYMVFTT